MKGEQKGKRWQTSRKPCHKKAYKDKDQAIRAIHIIQANSRDLEGHRVPIRYYFCHHCCKYHITSQENIYE